MALRHVFPVFDDGKISRLAEPTEPVKVVQPPFPVEFRRDGDLTNLIDAIDKHRSVRIQAATGSGKSVRVPSQIVRATGKLVVHTVPDYRLLHSLFTYVSSTTDVDTTLISDLKTPFPTKGLVFITNNLLVARILEDPLQFVVKFILYMDESHESDAATEIVRRKAPTWVLVDRFVTASATNGPSGFQKSERPGKVIAKTYPFEDCANWSALEDESKPGGSRPWHCSQLDGNALIYIDNPKVTQKLMQEYRSQGFIVHVLNADTTIAEFELAKKRLVDGNEVVILLADSRYFSGHNFRGLSYIIMSGLVRRVSVVNGKPFVSYRPIYAFENEQGLSRGARFPGESLITWEPNRPPVSRICDLEEVEADAAALIFRMLGNVPVNTLRKSKFFSGKVPLSLSLCLSDSLPLACYPEDALCDWVIPGWQVGMGTEKPVPPPMPMPRRPSPGRFRPASCRTVMQTPRPVSPPPPVPLNYRQQVYSDDEVTAMRSVSRPVSPAVNGLDLPDQSFGAMPSLSLGLGLGHMRSASASTVSLEVVDRAPVDIGHMLSHSQGQQVSADAFGDFDESRYDPHKFDFGFGNDFAVALDTVKVSPINELQRGEYYYYPGMEEAPSRSLLFYDGLPSILTYAARSDAKLHVDSMPEPDRLYAINVLLSAYNEAITQIRAVCRLGPAVMQKSELMKQVVDDAGYRRWITKIVDVYNSSTLAVTSYSSKLMLFARYNFHIMSANEQRERDTITSFMSELQEVVKFFDRDKMVAYGQTLSQQPILSLGMSADTVNSRSIMSSGISHLASPYAMQSGYGHRGATQSLGRITYTHQPTSGLSSILTKPFSKLLSGEVSLEFKPN